MKKIGVGIVTYNPDINRLKSNIDSISIQCKMVIIVDNGSSNIAEIISLADSENVHILRNESNLGISKALNQVMTYMEEMGIDWVLTLDQDSVAEGSMLEKYIEATGLENIGIICPTIIDRNTDGQKENDKKFTYINNCITSGSLTKVSAWKKIGTYDEKMFIDWVDFDFCKRMRIFGYNIVRINSAILLHEVGKITKHKFIFMNVEVQNHSAFRKYYMAQNIIYFARKYPANFEMIKAYLRIFKLLITIILYEEKKSEKVSMIFKGVLSGIKL